MDAPDRPDPEPPTPDPTPPTPDPTPPTPDPTPPAPDLRTPVDPDRHGRPDDAEVEALAMTLLADMLAAGPGVVRLATGIGWRMGTWAWRSSLGGAQRLVRAAMEGESVGSLTAEAVEAARSQARELLGLEMDRRPEDADPRRAAEERIDSNDHLRQRGKQLLAASADVHYEEPTHPAYDRILDELAPDEARILRLLCQEGPQPSVDVRTAGVPVVEIGSSMVAPGLTMIGAHAGVRYDERVPAYLNNLHRLGLVWFSREPVDDLVRYQVLEAQPRVAEALREAGRGGRTVRRSIHLTPFGRDFCLTCLDEPGPHLDAPPSPDVTATDTPSVP